MIDRHAEGPGNRIRRDVVMGGPDAASGEDIGIAGPKGVDSGDDLAFQIGNNPYFS